MLCDFAAVSAKLLTRKLIRRIEFILACNVVFCLAQCADKANFYPMFSLCHMLVISYELLVMRQIHYHELRTQYS